MIKLDRIREPDDSEAVDSHVVVPWLESPVQMTPVDGNVIGSLSVTSSRQPPPAVDDTAVNRTVIGPAAIQSRLTVAPVPTEEAMTVVQGAGILLPPIGLGCLLFHTCALLHQQPSIRHRMAGKPQRRICFAFLQRANLPNLGKPDVLSVAAAALPSPSHCYVLPSRAFR